MTKKVPEGAYMLNKMEIVIDDSKVDLDHLYTFVKQVPNHKMLGVFPFNLIAYNIPNDSLIAKKKTQRLEQLTKTNIARADKGKKPKDYKTLTGEWMMDVIGEAPVLYDDLLTSRTREQLRQALWVKGYFNAKVRDSINYHHNKANLSYIINTGTQYIIDTIKTHGDPVVISVSKIALYKPIHNILKEAKIKPGQPYDEDKFDRTRSLIANSMNNYGYYNFSKEYVKFRIDTSLNTNMFKVNLVIKDPKEKRTINGRDTTITVQHEVFQIRDVYINTQYRASDNISLYDTLMHNDLHFINSSKGSFKPKMIAKNIFIKPGRQYIKSNVDYTNKRLAALGTFKFINITFEEVYENGRKKLDCHINLTPSARQSLMISTDGTYRQGSGNLGMEGDLAYTNKNTFKGAERLNITFIGGIEAQSTGSIYDFKAPSECTNCSDVSGFDYTANTSTNLINLPFNTLQFGPEIKLVIPELLSPFTNSSKLPKYNSPKTNILAMYRHHETSFFKRKTLQTSFGYSWKTSTKHTHYFSPISISYVNIGLDIDFKTDLLASNNAFYIDKYSDHLITASNYHFNYNNQDLKNKEKSYQTFDYKIEGSGNTLNLAYPFISNKEKVDDSYEVVKVPFAQYILNELEFKLAYRISKAWLYYRGYLGAGIPLTNLNVLPYEKSFVGGGANGMRAFRARSLGPGNATNAVKNGFDQIGDIKIEGNIEYAFPIYKMMHGAIFYDAGNIWLTNGLTNSSDETDAKTYGEFSSSSFYKEIAMGVGMGARFDFSFLIIRLDWGLPIKDPAYAEGGRWIFQDAKDKDKSFKGILNTGVLNLGIGYPFY